VDLVIKLIAMKPFTPLPSPAAFLPGSPAPWPYQSYPYSPCIPVSAPPFLRAPEKWYEEECKKLDIQNMALLRTIDSLEEECVAVKAKLLEFDHPDSDRIHRKNLKKRRRRVAMEIPRHFQCAICSKAYG